MSDDATVFLVDDDPGALDSMQFLLNSNGFAVRSFTSARQFLDVYDPDRAGCLVLDLRMPEMDGLELLKLLRSGSRCLPIIFVTGHGNVPQCAQALKAGAFDFLEKPVRPQVIVERVQQAVEADERNRRVQAAQRIVVERVSHLTPREKEVLPFLLRGDDMKLMARLLSISIQTVAKHRARVLSKLQVRNEAELVRFLGDNSLPSAFTHCGSADPTTTP